jgi:hypothetical protein
MSHLTGACVVDQRTGRVGVVMGHVGNRLQLRPLGGGREWDCPPTEARTATPAERLSETNAVVNARSRGRDRIERRDGDVTAEVRHVDGDGVDGGGGGGGGDPLPGGPRPLPPGAS